MKKWNNIEYQRIASIELNGTILKVEFENKDTVEIPLERLAISLDDQLKIAYNPFELVFHTASGQVEIPWDQLRVLTDPDFARHLGEQAAESARTVGNKLKAIRESKGIRANELARRSGVTPQTITRIEKGHTDVSFTTLRKMLASMGAKLSDLAEVEETEDCSERNYASLLRKLSKVGVNQNWLLKRIIPRRVHESLMTFHGNEPDLLLDEAVSYLSSVYGWNSDEIWRTAELTISDRPSSLAYFKKPTNSNLSQIKAYSHYAHYIAKIVLKVSKVKKPSDFPADTEEFRSILMSQYHGIQLSSILNYTWDMGIAVIPLDDSGVFHGASWNIDGRHAIILKQKTMSHARWIFDLLHEIYHVFVHLEEPNSAVIETAEISPFSTDEPVEEREANSFANQVIFQGRAEELAGLCVSRAKWKVENLKSTVQKVAKEENISVDFLANYLAFRLANQGHSWWATANGFQIEAPNPYVETKEFLLSRIDLNKTNPIERNLLSMAVE